MFASSKASRFLVILTGCLLVPACDGVGLDECRLSKETYDRIKAGMTLQEVEALLGRLEHGVFSGNGIVVPDCAGAVGRNRDGW